MDIPREMLQKEIARIFESVLMDCNDLEKAVVRGLIMESAITEMAKGLPARTNRLHHEVMHRWYCIIEGMEKK